ncbi:MAG: hypothetical protein MUO23_13675 [Anaerolineales bacterium]|nr:hypothetical protein [Anaerolineales bacterium]
MRSSLHPLKYAGTGRATNASIGPTPFEQSQRSWARSIASYADAPGAYWPFFEPLQQAGVPFPNVVVAPTYEGFLHRETEKLVCASSGEVCILEMHGDRLGAGRYPMCGITCLRVSSALLDARITIMGLGQDGLAPTSSTIRFNAVTDFLFAPIMRRIRTGEAASTASSAASPDPFKAWGRRNLKFMNYAGRCLLEGEVVVQAILQPEILVGVASAFGRTYRRTVSPTHATILTDRELITIQEIPHKGDHERYGGLWTYLPLDKIEQLSITVGHHRLTALGVQLRGDTYLQYSFEPSARNELDALVGRFMELKAGILEKAAQVGQSQA